MLKILMRFTLLLCISNTSYAIESSLNKLKNIEVKAWAYEDSAQIQLMDNLLKSTIIIRIYYNASSKNQVTIETDSLGMPDHLFSNINRLDDALALIEALNPGESLNIFLFGPREVDPLLRKQKDHPKPVFEEISLREMRSIINSDLSQEKIDFYLLKKTILKRVRQSRSVKFIDHTLKNTPTCAAAFATN